jgi:hypothetical protein
MKKIIVVMLAILAVSAAGVSAQSTDQDPAVRAAKEETEVVYDLGRFFGYVWRLQQEYADLGLSRAQMESFYEVMEEIVQESRIEPDWAEEVYERLELDVLDVEQLMQVDMFVLERDETRSTGTGTGSGNSGSGTGSGPILTYIEGGAFNPIVDDTKSQGQDFLEFHAYLKGQLGR